MNDMNVEEDKPNATKLGWKKFKSTYVLQNPWFSIRQDNIQLPSGKQIEYSYLVQKGAVIVVPLTHDKKIIMIKQYRYTIDSWQWEVVAGGLGDKGDKMPEEVAREELAEEIGATADNLEKLAMVYTAYAVSNIRTHLFLARGVKINQKPARGLAEEISEVKEFSIDEVKKMIQTGEILDGESVIALQFTFEKL